jgi:predicted SprT family Zn-dependent metalloprotease
MAVIGTGGLLASAAMDGAATVALRRTDARSVEGILRRLGALWEAPELVDIPVALNPRLSRTLGRLVGRPWHIELGPRALVSSTRLLEVVTHEGAHAVLAMKAGRTHPAPHGPEWRELMAIAGYADASAAHWRCHSPAGQSPQQKQPPKPKPQPAITYDHWCPVCQSSRQARRPVKAWRCAACVAVGLDGTLEITRRTRRPRTTP